MTERDDPKTEAIFKALRELEDVDDKLMKRPEVAHLPSVLEEGELPECVARNGNLSIVFATDRRIINISASILGNSIRRVESFRYEAIRTVRAETGLLSTGLSMLTEDGVKVIASDKDTRQRFANYVRDRIGMEPQLFSASESSSSKVPWFVGSVLIVVAAVAIVLVLGSGGDETPTLAPTAPSSTSVATPRATPVPISAREYKRTTIILFNELLSMVEGGVVSPLVPDLGFSQGNPRARRWYENVQELRSRGESLEVVDRCFRLSDAVADVVCGGELISFVSIMVGDYWDWYLELADKFLELSIQE